MPASGFLRSPYSGPQKARSLSLEIVLLGISCKMLLYSVEGEASNEYVMLTRLDRGQDWQQEPFNKAPRASSSAAVEAAVA